MYFTLSACVDVCYEYKIRIICTKSPEMKVLHHTLGGHFIRHTCAVYCNKPL